MSPPRRACSENIWWRDGCDCEICFNKRRAWNRRPDRRAYMAEYRRRPDVMAKDNARHKARPHRNEYQREWKRRRAREDRARWRCECDALNTGRAPCACGRPRTWKAA